MATVRIGVLFGLIAALGYGTSAWWYASVSRPRLEVSPEFDLGELRHDEELELAIGFRNVGDAVLHMEQPIPGCKCALAELSHLDFLPGESGAFRFKLRPARPPGTDYAQEIVVPSNDPIEPRRIVTVRGRMEGSLSARPQIVSVRRALVGQEWTKELIVQCTDRKVEFEIAAVTSDLADLIAHSPVPVSEEGAPEGAAYQLRLTQIPLRVGRTSGEIVIKTNHSRFSELRVPVRIDVRSQLTAEPASLLFSSKQLL